MSLFRITVQSSKLFFEIFCNFVYLMYVVDETQTQKASSKSIVIESNINFNIQPYVWLMIYKNDLHDGNDLEWCCCWASGPDHNTMSVTRVNNEHWLKRAASWPCSCQSPVYTSFLLCDWSVVINPALLLVENWDLWKSTSYNVTMVNSKTINYQTQCLLHLPFHLPSSILMIMRISFAAATNHF